VEKSYFSGFLDIDGLDPAFAPGTGTPEPGGLTYQQVTDLIFAVGRCRKVIGADVVEVLADLTGVTTEFLAARLAYKIITAARLKK
jgi:agmatinase